MRRRGAAYAEQQATRRPDNPGYARQEAWLHAFLSGRASELGRPLRVLDFGVGFGRMAHVLADIPELDYHGFDISEAMLEPLWQAPPARYADGIRERVRIGDDVREVFGEQRFDVVFTVSVMIHNSPAQAADVLAGMRAVMAADGVICLVENVPVSVSMLANEWHAGCWVHDVAGTLAPDMHVDVDGTSIPGHGIYLLRDAPGAREVRVLGGDGFEAVDEGAYLLRTRAATVAFVQGLEQEIEAAPATVAEARDQLELYGDGRRHLAEVLERVHSLLGGGVAGAEGEASVASVLSLLECVARELQEERAERDRLAASVAALQRELDDATGRVDTLSWQVGLRTRIGQWMREPLPGPARKKATSPGAATDAVHRPARSFEFNAARDTRFAHAFPDHDRVCHMMHHEWFGIRAAAGALPGQKLAVSAHRSPTSDDLVALLDVLQAAGVDRIVAHGYSAAMRSWIQGLVGAGLDQVFLVWHGAPAMWVHGEERALMRTALEQVRSGAIRRMHIMRPGSHGLLGKSAWEPQLFNMPPRYERRRGERRGTSPGIAFAPSWNLLHKNLSTNIAAAMASPAIGEVWTLAPEFELPYRAGKSLKVLPRLDQTEMMETMELADVVLNASIVDCHPMIELEALAAGTPAVRGRLGLDALEDHPYVRLTEVADPLSIRDVQAVIDRIMAVPRDELEAMMASYARDVVALSHQRYSDMLGI